MSTIPHFGTRSSLRRQFEVQFLRLGGLANLLVGLLDLRGQGRQLFGECGGRVFGVGSPRLVAPLTDQALLVRDGRKNCP